MSITVVCDCGREYSLSDDKAGRRFRCKDCDETLVVRKKQRKRRKARVADDWDDNEDDWDEDDDWNEPRRPRSRSRGRKASRGGRGGRGSGPSGGIVVWANIVKYAGLVLGIVAFAFGFTVIAGGVGAMRVVLICVAGGTQIGGGIVASLAASAKSSATDSQRTTYAVVGTVLLAIGTLVLLGVIATAPGKSG